MQEKDIKIHIKKVKKTVFRKKYMTKFKENKMKVGRNKNREGKRQNRLIPS